MVKSVNDNSVVSYFYQIASLIQKGNVRGDSLNRILEVKLPQAIYQIITSPELDGRDESHFDGGFFDDSALHVAGKFFKDSLLPCIEISDKRIAARNRGTFGVLITFADDFSELYITLIYHLLTESDLPDEDMRYFITLSLFSNLFVAPCLYENGAYQDFDEWHYSTEKHNKPLFSYRVSLSDPPDEDEFNRNLFQVCVTLQRAVYNELKNYAVGGMAFTSLDSLFPVPPEPTNRNDSGGFIYPVWFGTNREPILSGARNVIGFENKRGKSTVYGRCDVFVPKHHKFGEIGSGFWKRLWQGYDDRLQVTGLSSLESQSVFIEQLKKHLDDCGDIAQQGLIFVHGYNVDFDESIVRAAQIGVDLKIPLSTVYSWPSRGVMRHYNTDEETIRASVKHITEFLETIAESFPVGTFNLIVHSMGNRGVLEAIHRIVTSGKGSIKFGKVFLAAPDVDVDIFNELAQNYPLVSEKTTLYISSKDKAVAFSKILHGGYDRVGYSPPVTVIEGIDTIEVSGVDLSFLGHGYYAEAHPVIYDIKQALTQTNTDARLRITSQSDKNGKTYWVLSA